MSISTIASVTENCNAVILSTDVYRKSFWPMMHNQINYLAHLIIHRHKWGDFTRETVQPDTQIHRARQDRMTQRRSRNMSLVGQMMYL